MTTTATKTIRANESDSRPDDKCRHEGLRSFTFRNGQVIQMCPCGWREPVPDAEDKTWEVFCMKFDEHRRKVLCGTPTRPFWKKSRNSAGANKESRVNGSKK